MTKEELKDKALDFQAGMISVLWKENKEMREKLNKIEQILHNEMLWEDQIVEQVEEVFKQGEEK